MRGSESAELKEPSGVRCGRRHVLHRRGVQNAPSISRARIPTPPVSNPLGPAFIHVLLSLSDPRTVAPIRRPITLNRLRLPWRHYDEAFKAAPAEGVSVPEWGSPGDSARSRFMAGRATNAGSAASRLRQEEPMDARQGSEEKPERVRRLGRGMFVVYPRTGAALAIFRVSLLAWVHSRNVSDQMTETVYNLFWLLRPSWARTL